MITHVRIRDWRNYEELDLDLGPGATFIVAANGVGKTSLIEAIRWALFGLTNGGSSPTDAVRATATEAWAEVTVDLGKRGSLVVRRVLPRRPTRVSEPTASLNGEPLTPDEMAVLLGEVFEANYSFLSRLLVPFGTREQTSTKPDQIGLEQHLGRMYGVDNLQEAITHLTHRIKANEKEIKAVKAAHAADPHRVTELRLRVQSSDAHQRALEGDLETLEAELDQARDIEAAHLRRNEWATQKMERDRAVTALTSAAAGLFGRTVAPDSVGDVIAAREDELSNSIRDLQVNQGINRSRIETLETNRERLDSAHDDCPVCRRPLDDATIALAHTSTDMEIDSLRHANETLAIDETRLLQDLKTVRELRVVAQRIPTLGPQPTAAPHNEIVRASTDLTPLVREARQALLHASTEHRHAQANLETELSASSANDHLVALWAEAAHLHAAKESTQATLTELLEGTIAPLESEISRRWTSLFPDRGDVTTTPGGQIKRNLNGIDLPYEAFSAGESVGAILLLRLLVVQMATSASFCWFDEPLEHLDPETRRDVANLLSRVTNSNGPLKQVVVTTYEDQLAQRLQDRDPDHVRLVYVRHSPSSHPDAPW
jgi:DNA repair exonuclease SbcCD ATPase subunit